MASNEASPHAEPTAKRLSVLTRNSVYRQTCTAWFSPGHTPDYASLWQAHHVACDHALGGRELKDADREYIEQCLWITDWKLNDADNLVGMPLNRQYRESDGKTPVNLPSHQVDHNTTRGYTDECKDWLKTNLWDTLKAGQDPHTVNPKDVAATLKLCTTTFKAKLVGRGIRKGAGETQPVGTIAAWTGRFDPANKDTWYHPFSMGADPEHRSPGVSAGTLTGLFKLIKLA